jgi:hypothetical protein
MVRFREVQRFRHWRLLAPVALLAYPGALRHRPPLVLLLVLGIPIWFGFSD